MSRTVIIGTGKYLPDNIMTNDDLSNIVDTSDEWISTNRYTAAKDFNRNEYIGFGI